MDLMESDDGRLEALNDLFLTCLDTHAPKNKKNEA